MTDQECISGLEVLKQIPHAKNFVEHIDMAIKALEQTDGDYISRAEVLKLIDYINFRNFRSYENLIAKINDLPSVTPKPYKEDIE